jgi:hypothetical protein
MPIRKPLSWLITQAGGEIAVRRLLDHRRQRFHDLILGVVDVLEGMGNKSSIVIECTW